MSGNHFVYLYRSLAGVAKYVGYGADVKRAMSHAGASHNHELKQWLEADRFDVTIAGPYSSESEAKKVEAALISAMKPEFNKSPGDGPTFLPIGVPPELAARPTLQPLTLEEIGRCTGGALLVYLAGGDFLSDGRPKFDPANPDNDVVVGDMEAWWDLRSVRDQWLEHPASSPRVLIGVHGKVKHRFIAAATLIDSNRWTDVSLYNADRRRWKVPLLEPVEFDAYELRGRRVSGIKFGQFSWALHLWVDGSGNVRHPAP
jgi:hypothetical protein